MPMDLTQSESDVSGVGIPPNAGNCPGKCAPKDLSTSTEDLLDATTMGKISVDATSTGDVVLFFLCLAARRARISLFVLAER